MRLADGLTLDFADNGARILDDAGVERMRLVAPVGWDSSTVAPDSIDGRRQIRVSMRQGEDRSIGGRLYPTIELVPNPDDLASAKYPVEIDPTVQITGTTDIEDSFLYATAPTKNYGAFNSGYAKLDLMRTVIRIASGSIPGGNITGFRLYQYFYTFSTEIRAFFVSDSNDWVEGTASGAEQDRSSCWNQCKLNEQDWAGHPVLGCSEPIDDFDADATPPTTTPGGIGWNTFTLDPAWPPLWRAGGGRVANGVVIDSLGAVTTRWRSTEDGTYPLYLEIDHEEAGGSPVAAMLKRRICE